MYILILFIARYGSSSSVIIILFKAYFPIVKLIRAELIIKLCLIIF